MLPVIGMGRQECWLARRRAASRSLQQKPWAIRTRGSKGWPRSETGSTASASMLVSQVRMRTVLAWPVNCEFSSIATSSNVRAKTCSGIRYFRNPDPPLPFPYWRWAFLFKTLKYKGSHQIFLLKRMILLITLLSRPPQGFHSDSHSCQYCDMICHILLKKKKKKHYSHR